MDRLVEYFIYAASVENDILKYTTANYDKEIISYNINFNNIQYNVCYYKNKNFIMDFIHLIPIANFIIDKLNTNFKIECFKYLKSDISIEFENYFIGINKEFISIECNDDYDRFYITVDIFVQLDEFLKERLKKIYKHVGENTKSAK